MAGVPAELRALEKRMACRTPGEGFKPDPEGTSGVSRGTQCYLVRDFEQENNQVKSTSQRNILEAGREAKQ